MQSANLEKRRRDVTKSTEERRKAAFDIVKVEEAKLATINTENQKAFDAEAARIKTRTGLDKVDLVSFLRTYREKEGVRNKYFEDEQKLISNISRSQERLILPDGKVQYLETEQSSIARGKLEAFYKSQTSEMKIYLDLLERWWHYRRDGH